MRGEDIERKRKGIEREICFERVLGSGGREGIRRTNTGGNRHFKGGVTRGEELHTEKSSAQR